jgi:hypothetical protein
MVTNLASDLPVVESKTNGDMFFKCYIADDPVSKGFQVALVVENEGWEEDLEGTGEVN